MTASPLAALVRAPREAGLFLDFDGVLADIAPTPDGAVPRPGMPELLVELEARLGRVAIVSGRPVDYLDPHIPDQVDIVGLYGLESRVAGERATLPEAESWRPVMGELIASGAPEVRDGKLHLNREPGLGVELLRDALDAPLAVYE